MSDATIGATHYQTPIGTLTLTASSEGLTGAWFRGQRFHGAPDLVDVPLDAPTGLLAAATQWLDDYFGGSRPDPHDLQLSPADTEFRRLVWDLLCEVPYGEVVTYADLGVRVAQAMGRTSMSGQAIGGAVGHNPLSVIVPCHRVVGADGSLTGYAGGIDRKTWLLTHEGVDMTGLFPPADPSS